MAMKLLRASSGTTATSPSPSILCATQKDSFKLPCCVCVVDVSISHLFSCLSVSINEAAAFGRPGFVVTRHVLFVF